MLELGTEVIILAESYPGRVGTVRGILQRSTTGRAIETQYQIGDGWYSEEELAVVVKQREVTPEQNERDTHFKHFAELLYEDFLQLARDDESTISEMLADNYPEQWRAKVECLIAQRAYDLVLHTVYHISVRDLESLLMVEVAERVPDIAAWPDEEKPDASL